VAAAPWRDVRPLQARRACRLVGFKSSKEIAMKDICRMPTVSPAPHARRRRRLLQALSALPLRGGLPAGSLAAGLPVRSLAATPSCSDEARATPRQTEGPYFTPDSPQRRSLIDPDVGGTRLVLSGRVLGLDCTPVAGALLDFWQADADGVYDNRSYGLRGHQFADPQGRYRLETIVPGIYPGRTRHIHVKVQAKGGRVLTTQLYFPDEPGNRRDFLFSPALLVTLVEPARADTTMRLQQLQAAFDFAVATG
jgi:protocatechuate 3,4-dioxygenase beta subunit